MRHFFLFSVLLIVISACHTTVCGITEETSLHDTTYITKWKHDSVRVHDSVYHEQIIHDDTVIIREKYFHNYFWSDVMRDTIYQSKTDTLNCIETVYQEKKDGDNVWLGIAIGALFMALTMLGLRYFLGK